MTPELFAIVERYLQDQRDIEFGYYEDAETYPAHEALTALYAMRDNCNA